MQREAQAGTEGYVSTFVEIFAWVLTVPAYEALWQLLHPFTNPYGWGYDFWYDNYAAARVPGHKMGIISTLQVMLPHRLTDLYAVVLEGVLTTNCAILSICQ
jgi:hypothetical protein